MRSGELVTLIASGVLSAGAWAAVAENLPPERAVNTPKAALKPVPVDAGLSGAKSPERKRTWAPQASGTAAKIPLPQLDAKNLGPAWLDNAHKNLDAAVAAAYGWTDYSPQMPNEEILRRLLALNLERAARAKGESP